MTDDEDEDRRARVERTLKEAREVLRRTSPKALEKQRREIEDQSPVDIARTLIPSAPVDRVAMWRRDAERRAAERAEVKALEQARSDLVYKKYEQPAPVDSDAWGRWMSEYVERAIAQEREFIFDLIGTVIGETFEEHLKSEHRDAEFAGEIAKLWRGVAEAQRGIANIIRDRGVDAMRDVTLDAKRVN
jgi:hypothetical protein